MDLVRQVKADICSHKMINRGCKVLAAVSGGPDSMTMLHILYLLREELGISLHVAHLNHMFRGADSEADARFVAGMAQRYGLSATIEARDVPGYKNKHRLSGQVAAREMRYRFLRETADQVGASRIALAHQADDQAETVLINFLRGTGLTGLKGMFSVREGLYIRPLLQVRRSEIERYCDEIKLPYRQDYSNLKTYYFRNKVRLDLMPLLESEYNPALVPALLRLSEICREEDVYLEDRAETAFRSCLLEKDGVRVVLSLGGLKELPLAVRRRVLRRAWQSLDGKQKNLAFRHVETILDLIRSGRTGARAVLPGNVSAVRSYKTLELTAELEKPAVPYYIYPVKIPGSTYIPEIGRTVYTELFRRDPSHKPENLPPSEAMLDFDKLPPRVFVRRRREGDVFKPFGQTTELKLKDFFIKQKVSRKERDWVPLIGTPNKILWVGGIRTGESYKIDQKTDQVLYLKLLS